MKKTLLFIALIFGMISISPAQISKESYRKYMKKPVAPSQSKVDYPKKDVKLFDATEKSVKDDIERIQIAKSPNAYSILGSEHRVLSSLMKSNKGIYNYQFVFEPDPDSYTEVDENGRVAIAYSEDIYSWEHSFITNNNQYFKKPSGILYNPLESNDIEDYYTIICAQDSANNSWSNNSFISSQFNNDNYQNHINGWENEIDELGSSISVKDDEVFVFGQSFEAMGEYGVNQKLKHYHGTTDNIENGFEWQVSSVQPDWLIDPDDGFAYALYSTWSAWSNDRSIGYMWMIGVTNESYEYGVYQPQVYYTTDQGNTWNEIEINLENHEDLVDYLEPWIDDDGNPGTIRPSFLSGDRNFPGEVDYQGRLHLLASVFGSSKGDVLNPVDSNWVNPDARGGHVFDFKITPNGIQDINFISEIKSKVSTNMFGNIGFDHRLQLAKYEDECHMAAIWIDDVMSGTDSLVNPDIFGVDICIDGEVSWGSVRNLTEGTLYSGFYFFPNLAENIYIIDWVSYEMKLDITTSVTPSEWGNNDPSQAITHSFVTGLNINIYDYQYCCIDGTNEVNKNQIHFTFSQNTPNPFSDETKVEITSKFQEPKDVSLEISDLLGHIVYESFEGKIEEVKEISIHAKDLKSGVYFYTICVGEECQTKKMIVE